MSPGIVERNPTQSRWLWCERGVAECGLRNADCGWPTRVAGRGMLLRIEGCSLRDVAGCGMGMRDARCGLRIVGSVATAVRSVSYVRSGNPRPESRLANRDPRVANPD